MATLGYSAAETIYVGDDARDAQAAANAKVPFIAATWGYTGSGAAVSDWGAASLARHVTELPELAVRLLSR